MGFDFHYKYHDSQIFKLSLQRKFELIFISAKVVDRGTETQLQVGENFNSLKNLLRARICPLFR